MPSPLQWLLLEASFCAAVAAAVAPLFGNNPAVLAPQAFAAGLVVGLPLYVLMKSRRYKRK